MAKPIQVTRSGGTKQQVAQRKAQQHKPMREPFASITKEMLLILEAILKKTK